MQKAAMAASMPPVDNRHGKKQCVIDVMQPPENAVELVLWKKTPKHLEAEAMEKQEKQHHSMCVHILWDKLAARRGKRFKLRKKPDETLLEKMERNEDEIEKLELELEEQQQLECD
ncbi:hypothetical protein MHU86_14203 [Fragilaria crotonensis]|nr:hypothetical protein MHU86_14203 [Fragilaria crotonensis]